MIEHAPDRFMGEHGQEPIPPGALLSVVADTSGQALRARQLVVDGTSIQGAEFVQPHLALGASPDSEVMNGLALLEQARADRVGLVYAGASTVSTRSVLVRLGFEPAFEAHLRNLHLGSVKAVQHFARLAVGMRNKLIEVDLSDDWLGHAAGLFEARRGKLGFAVRRDLAYLKQRYQDAEKGYRMLVLRRRAGCGIDAFVIVREFDYSRGRRAIRLVDHWTRNGDRRAMAWLLGELAVWGLAEGADVLQGFAVAHSQLDQTLVASGCIRKKSSGSFMVRRIGPTPAGAARLIADNTQLRAGDLAQY